MGIFGGTKRAPGDYAPDSTYTPDLGDMSIPTDPYAGQRPARGGIFGNLGPNKQALLGGLFDWMAQQGGGQATYVPTMLKRQEEETDAQRRMQQWQAQRDYERQVSGDDQQVVNIGNGGVGTFSRNGGFQTVREPTPDTPALQQNWDWFSKLSPEDQETARMMMPGAQYTPQGIAAQGQIAEVRAGATARHRAPPRSGGNGKVTATSRAALIAQAESAIAKGADRNAVYARLAKMGVQ